jgi:hypothetical protein
VSHIEIVELSDLLYHQVVIFGHFDRLLGIFLVQIDDVLQAYVASILEILVSKTVSILTRLIPEKLFHIINSFLKSKNTLLILVLKKSSSME